MVREIIHIEGVYLLAAQRPGRTPLYYIGEASDINNRFCTHRKNAKHWSGLALSRAERRIAPSQYKVRMFLLRELNGSSAAQRQKHERLFKVAAARMGLTITNRNRELGRDLADTDFSVEVGALEEVLNTLRSTNAS